MNIINANQRRVIIKGQGLGHPVANVTQAANQDMVLDRELDQGLLPILAPFGADKKDADNVDHFQAK